MNRTIKWAFLLLALFWSSTACEFGIAVPTPASEEVELSVLVQPADKGYVEMNGSIIAPGVSVPVKRGKLVNLVARSSDEGWEFARWERGLTGTSSEEALLMDSTKVVLAVFASISPIASAPEPTRTPVAGQGSPSTTSGPTSTPVAEPVSPTATPTPTSTPPSTPVPPPVASFSVNLSSGSAPLAVQFSDTSLGTITSWQWDFGDGGTSAERSPIHRYTIAGSHTARLTVSGPGGTDTSVLADSITVQPGPPVSLEVSPSSATLAVQKVARFEAVARDEFGNDVLSAITWSTTAGGGSIRPDGLFTAGTIAGAFSDTVTASLLTDTLELIASASVTVEPGPLFEASIHPAETSLDIGSVQSFEVGMRDRFGNPIPEALISWKTTEDAGTVNADGQFTAGTKAGSFPGAVQVEAVTGGERASAAADVSIGPDPLATIEVQPSFIVVEKGITQQFLAAGFDLYGNEIPDLAFLWEATGGDITQDGLYTAGGESGSYEVSVAAVSITIDGDPSDWTAAGIQELITDPPGDYPPPAGLDMVSLRVTDDGTNVYFLYEFAGPPQDSSFLMLDVDTDSTTGCVALGVGFEYALIFTPSSPATGIGDTRNCSSVPSDFPGALTFSVAGNFIEASVLIETLRILSPTLSAFDIACADDDCTNARYTLVTPTKDSTGSGSATVAIPPLWSPVGNMLVARRSHDAVLLPDGRVLIVSEGAELYDPVTRTFTAGNPRCDNGSSSRATLLADGRVLMTGGSSEPRCAEVYDPETGAFSRVGDLNADHSNHATTLLSDGRVLVVGGLELVPGGWVTQAVVEIYDPVTETFSVTGSLNTARSHHLTVTSLPSGQVLITGGWCTGQALASPELRGGLVCLNSAARFDKWNRAAVG